MTKSSKNFRRNGASQYTINIVDNAIGYISCHEWLQNVSPKLMTSLQYRIWNIEKWRNGVVLQLKDLFLLVFEVNLPFKVKFGCKRFALQITKKATKNFWGMEFQVEKINYFRDIYEYAYFTLKIFLHLQINLLLMNYLVF